MASGQDPRDGAQTHHQSRVGASSLPREALPGPLCLPSALSPRGSPVSRWASALRPGSWVCRGGAAVAAGAALSQQEVLFTAPSQAFP